jgi:cytoplasmic iron level regulating protein YaaA (DUF328/UPF0246 family)
MITILSPAKTIEEHPENRFGSLTEPAFLNEANYLAGLLKNASVPRLRKLMNISQELAELNQERFFRWEGDISGWPDLPALLAFRGEVFRGAGAWEWSREALDYSVSHLRILSGLFGVLRPNDRIRPYRLEMGTALRNRSGSDLYSFWEKKITKAIDSSLKEDGSGIIVNLASNEYFKAIDTKKLNIRVITPSFKDFHNGSYRFLTVYGKNARGEMTRFIMENRIRDAEELKAFDTNGYSYNPRLSKGDSWVFTRG